MSKAEKFNKKVEYIFWEIFPLLIFIFIILLIYTIIF